MPTPINTPPPPAPVAQQRSSRWSAPRLTAVVEAAYILQAVHR